MSLVLSIENSRVLYRGWSVILGAVATTETRSVWLEENLGLLGVVLAYLVAGLHLAHPKLGLPRLMLLYSTDSLYLLANHPRPLVFVVSGLAIVVGVALAGMEYQRRLIYGLGILLMASFILVYAAWHLSGHGGFLPGRKPLYHGLTPFEALIGHITTDTWAALTKLSELALLSVLAVLYRRETE